MCNATFKLHKNALLRQTLLSVSLLSLSSLPILVQAADAPAEKPLGQINDHWKINGDFRARYETFDFFQPNATNNNNDYDFWALRTRLGVQYTDEFVDAYAQGEYSGVYGLPNNAQAAPGGALGLGALYYTENNRQDNISDVHLKQAYANFKFGTLGFKGLSLKLGRFEQNEGMEYKTGDAKYDTLKLTRVSQRMMGSFEFAHAGRQFDGAMLVQDHAKYNFTFSTTHPTQGGFNLNAQDQNSHIDLIYAALTGKKDAFLPGLESRLFYLYYGDNRNIQVVDNRSAAQRLPLSQQNLSIHTVGTHWLTVNKLGPGAIDGLFWGAYQFGDWANLDHSAYAFDLETGYQLTELPLKPWLRGGFYQGSGDSNSKDGKHGTFFSVLPTVRIYAKFPYFNLMNINDAFAQLVLTPTASTKVNIDYHHLTLAETSDLFYAGAGATSRNTFGVAGRAPTGSGSLGELVDITFNYVMNKHFNVTAYYAHAFGGQYEDTFYAKRHDADYAYVEFLTSF